MSEHGFRGSKDSRLQSAELEKTLILRTLFRGAPLPIKHRFYAETELTRKLLPLAENVALIEGFKAAKQWERHSSEKESSLDLESVSASSDSRCVLEPLLSKVEKGFSENDSKKLRDLIDALDKYNDGFRDRPHVEQAALHVLVAGQMLSHLSTFSLPKIKTLAQILWAGARCRAKRKPAELSFDDPNLQTELAALPEIKWARVWENLGINRKLWSKRRGKSSGQKRPSTRKQ